MVIFFLRSLSLLTYLSFQNIIYLVNINVCYITYINLFCFKKKATVSSVSKPCQLYHFHAFGKEKFMFCVIIKGHKTGLLNSWLDALDLVSTFQNPLWVGYDSLHDAFEFARKQLSPNFFISPSIKSRPLEFDISRNPAILCQNCENISKQLIQLQAIQENLLKKLLAATPRCLCNKVSKEILRWKIKISALKLRH